MNILLADDEKLLLKFLERGPRAEGYKSTPLNVLHEVMPCITKKASEIVVFDCLFNNEDTLATTEATRALPTPPIILMLTALDDVSEWIRGLKRGADNYLCKPFDLNQLLARISALRRRTIKQVRSQKQTLVIDPLKLVIDERIALIKEIEISLTNMKFELLVYLTKNQKKCCLGNKF